MDENANEYAVFVQSVLKFFALCNRVDIGGNEQPDNILKPYRLIYTVFFLENSAYCDLSEFIILYFVFSMAFSFLWGLSTPVVGFMLRNLPHTH